MRQGPRTAIRKGDWKIVYNSRNKEWELFNLAEDLEESRNLAGRYPGKLKELVLDWEKLNKQMAEPFF